MPTFEEFQGFDVRVGTVVSARIHPTAKKPAFQMEIDFGPAGIKRSSAQLTTRYEPAGLVGRQVAAVLGFPPRRIGDFTSEVLVLGAILPGNEVVLLAIDAPVPNGSPVA
ncbi:MAG: tRNA-binding protein [Gemmatimonadetes bacterium]|nr:tRNA-binding protein [Gemmatimonadota bacterium]